MSDKYDIVIAGIIGANRALEYIDKNKTDMNPRLFDDDFIERILDVDKQNVEMKSYIEANLREGIICHEVKGSVYDALWKMACEFNTGFSVQGKEIPVAQEIIEIYEVMGEDIYRSKTENVYIFYGKAVQELVENLRERGFVARVVGRTHRDKKRVVVNGDRVTYLKEDNAG